MVNPTIIDYTHFYQGLIYFKKEDYDKLKEKFNLCKNDELKNKITKYSLRFFIYFEEYEEAIKKFEEVKKNLIMTKI